jgi:CRISPR/Cas system-associated protein endoribonuclease Cas2
MNYKLNPADWAIDPPPKLARTFDNEGNYSGTRELSVKEKQYARYRELKEDLFKRNGTINELENVLN